MIQKLTNLLEFLGYEVTANDAYGLQFSLDCTEQYIKNHCNIAIVPVELEYSWLNLAAANFLASKYSTGQLSSEQIEQVVKRIQDGDATVEYAASTDPNVTFVNYLNELKGHHSNGLNNFRKLRW